MYPPRPPRTPDDIKKLAISFCTGERAYCDLTMEVDVMDETQRRFFASWSSEYCQRAGTIEAYASARMVDNNHYKALDMMNRVRAKIRKAIGFAYPKADILF